VSDGAAVGVIVTWVPPTSTWSGFWLSVSSWLSRPVASRPRTPEKAGGTVAGAAVRLVNATGGIGPCIGRPGVMLGSRSPVSTVAVPVRPGTLAVIDIVVGTWLAFSVPVELLIVVAESNFCERLTTPPT
jgi:hypothetical protein